MLRHDLSRRGGNRQPRRRILIVCEGERTEALYFEALKKDFRLPNANINIVPSRRDPLAIVALAVRGIEEENYDEAWCIFDTEFGTYNAKFVPAVVLADKKDIQLAISNPAFEFWLLLHFGYTLRTFSNATELEAAVRDKYTAYTKNNPQTYASLRDKQEGAIKYAEQVMAEQAKVAPKERFPQPFTSVHRLVDYLARQRDFRK